MAKAAALQSNFSGGEMSPLMFGRVDDPRYKTGLATCLNFLPVIQGGLTRRPGTYYAAEVKNSLTTARLQPFEFSIIQAYMLEFGDFYIRFHKNDGLVTFPPVAITAITHPASIIDPIVVTAPAHGLFNGARVVISGVSGMTQVNNLEFRVANVTTNTFELRNAQFGFQPDGTGYGTYVTGGSVALVYEIASNYAAADVMNLRFTQSDDVLYIVHPNYVPVKLSRTGDTNWTLAAITFIDGPYMGINVTTTTMTPSAAVGVITMTASSTVGINNGLGFLPSDVGRFIRAQEGAVRGYGVITGWTDSKNVTVQVKTNFANTNPKPIWQLGLYSQTTGFPSCCTFHEDRLYLAGSAAAPQRFDGSVLSNYEDFTPSAWADGAVTDQNALGFNLNSNDVNVIYWMTSSDQGLQMGTANNEWLVAPSSSATGLTPTNVNAKIVTSYGSANVQAVQVGRSTLFLQRAARMLRELLYVYYAGGFLADDMTVYSEHITGSGATQMDLQKVPQSFLWVVRNDGTLLSLTYQRGAQDLKVGWGRHIIGGVSDAVGSKAVVESIGVIPSSDGTRDQVWLIVRRLINGTVRRYVEYITKLFEEVDQPADAFFVDSGLTYDVPVNVSLVSNLISAPITVTAVAHGFSNGDTVSFSGMLGVLSPQLNGNKYVIGNVSTNTFDLIDFEGFETATGVLYPLSENPQGRVRKLVSLISGLNHLEGQTVSILADGAVQPQVVVTKGDISLSSPAATVHIGLPFNSDGQMLRADSGSANGTALGKTRRTHRIGFLLHRTLGLKFGMSFDDLTEITFRRSSDATSQAVPLYDGIVSEECNADYDFENQICWRQDEPLPGTILAVMPQLETQDRG